MAIALLVAASVQAADAVGSYTPYRSPLVSPRFEPLALGQVRPDGWLLAVLRAQRDGATQRATALYPELGADSPWLGGSQNLGGQYWAERAPYYVKGLVALAYTLDDAPLKAQAERWLNWTLSHQAKNGALGPEGQDWWSVTPMLYALRDYADATGDSRVVPALHRYLLFALDSLDDRPLGSWAAARYGDIVDIALWTYNRTGDAKLLALVSKLAQQGYDWPHLFATDTLLASGDIMTKHAVNVAQALRTPALLSLVQPERALGALYAHATASLRRQHGQIGGGLTGTEMLAGNAAGAGSELCATVEHMHSSAIAQLISGEASLGDEREQLAFNALAGAITPDFAGHTYYTLPNVHQALLGPHGFEQDYDDALTPSPTSGYPCCRFNMHMGWPYYVRHMWGATPDGGLVALAYGPSHVTARVGAGVEATLREVTDYPFDETLRFDVEVPRATDFALWLRIPSWASAATVRVNGEAASAAKAGSYHRIARTWAKGDTVTLSLPMPLVVSRWVNHSVGISRGPLAFALDVGERAVSRAEGQLGEKSSAEPGSGNGELIPLAPYNIALELDPSAPAQSFALGRRPMPSTSPFDRARTPVYLSGVGRQIAWPTRCTLLAEPPLPAQSSQPAESITLVPYGSSRLRMSYLPLLSTEGSRIEAEQGTLAHGARIEATHSHYSGSGYVVLGERAGAGASASITLPIVAEASGAQHALIRYSAGSGPASLARVTLNGVDLRPPSFAATADFDTWADATGLVLPLQAGRNTLELTGGASALSIDALSLYPIEGVSYEAEHGILGAGAVVGSEHPRFSGRGYVDFVATPGAWVRLTVYASRTGTHALQLRYAAGDGRPISALDVSVNGRPICVTPLPPTGSWSVWQQSAPTDVQLVAGSNTLEVRCGTAPYLNLDAVTLVAADAP